MNANFRTEAKLQPGQRTSALEKRHQRFRRPGWVATGLAARGGIFPVCFRAADA